MDSAGGAGGAQAGSEPPLPLADAGATLPLEDAATQPLEDAAVRVDDDAGVTTPGDAGDTDLDDAGTTPPLDAGGPQPFDAGTPTDAGTQPTDAGTQPTDAGTQPADAGGTEPPARECGSGVALGDACWYLGARGASCNQVCATHGGYLARVNYVGVAAEGGSLANCDMLLDLLVGPGDTEGGYRKDMNPIGCHLFENSRWWLGAGPPFDPQASERVSRIVCSCNGP